MPVTAKFSEHFYNRLGHDIADELVGWFNSVDAIYRTEFRDLFDTNFRGFNARLGEQRAELESRMDRMHTELDAKIDRLDAKVDVRFGELDAKVDGVAAKIDIRFGELDAKIDGVDAKVDVRFGTLDAKIDRVAAEIRQDIAGSESRIIRALLLTWATTLLIVVGLMAFG